MELGALLHQQLLTYLRSHGDTKFSVIADSSTAITVEDNLSVRIQFVDEKLRVFNAQYGFIKLGTDLAGKTLFSLLRDRFEEDGMAEYMRDRIIGTTTDGGSYIP